MSAIVCFDIRNFSTHVSHLSVTGKGASKKVFAAVEEIFGSLDQEVKSVSKAFGISNKTYVIHTGDGFVAIFYGKGNCLQGLLVASLLATRVEKILAKYNRERDRHGTTESLPSLDYGMGIHLGPVHKFNYQPVYQPGNKTVGVGLLGHAINMANRVQEQLLD
jgi:class 3 adenylate cyclase